MTCKTTIDIVRVRKFKQSVFSLKRPNMESVKAVLPKKEQREIANLDSKSFHPLVRRFFFFQKSDPSNGLFLSSEFVSDTIISSRIDHHSNICEGAL